MNTLLSEGAEEILSHNPLIMMEFSPNLYQEKFSVEKLINLLVGHSYRPFLLRDGKLEEISFDKLRATKEQVDVFLKK